MISQYKNKVKYISVSDNSCTAYGILFFHQSCTYSPHLYHRDPRKEQLRRLFTDCRHLSGLTLGPHLSCLVTQQISVLQ